MNHPLPTVPLLDLNGLSVLGGLLYESVLVRGRQALADQQHFDFRAELADAFIGETFTWPAFDAWRDYFGAVGWHPLAWDPWMVSEEPEDWPSVDRVTSAVRLLHSLTVGAAIVGEIRMRQIREAQRDGIIRGVKILSSGHRVSPLCAAREGHVYTDLDVLPPVPAYPGCGCVFRTILAPR